MPVSPATNDHSCCHQKPRTVCVQGVIELLGSIRIMRATEKGRFDKPTRIERQLVQRLAALGQARAFHSDRLGPTDSR